ncbi:MAG: small subunit ribosomal protein S5 [Parcubacteria group bacterium Licking1014_17]|nr:MAG: small subunit ribosomal protein S5 [Parcubacteria group bacterium Licking1014_17]
MDGINTNTKEIRHHRRSDFGGRPRPPREKSEFDSQFLDIARVTRVTKGGKRFSFRVALVIGDKKGQVGLGVAQGVDVAQAMQKATARAHKNLMKIPLAGLTIPRETASKYHSAMVILKPARPGSGIKAGGPVRAIAKLAGIQNITSKLVRRTKNKINIAQATLKALKSLKVNSK